MLTPNKQKIKKLLPPSLTRGRNASQHHYETAASSSNIDLSHRSQTRNVMSGGNNGSNLFIPPGSKQSLHIVSVDLPSSPSGTQKPSRDQNRMSPVLPRLTGKRQSS
mmetsp:Transcript_13236/g.20669  ORF Transcript_13236/g.20669 Transcript_13236/m.20669 type:complete len:107 (-) Transcript_13236:667-987(-)